MAGWDLALDMQNDLAHSFETDAGRTYLTAFATSVLTEGSVFNVNTGKVEKRSGEQPSEIMIQSQITRIEAAIASVWDADPIWVGGEIAELIDYAAAHEDFKPTAVYLDDLFIPKGFAYFEQPLYIPDIKGGKMAVRAFSWRIVQFGESGQEGALIALWSHNEDLDSYATETFKLPKIGGSSLHLAHVDAIPFGDKRVLDEMTTNSMLAVVETFWRLAKQEIILPGQERVGRPAARRKSNWRNIKHVTVLKLRRAKQKRYEEETDQEVEWTHRWMVRGHWRNQPYKVQGKVVYHQIWIEAFIKGPTDKPFVGKDRAVEFTR